MLSKTPSPSLEKKRQVQNKALKSLKFKVYKKNEKKNRKDWAWVYFVEGAFKHCVSRTKMDPIAFVITNHV